MKEPFVKLIVGLGNPGDKYRWHRHNLGFRVIDELARRRGLPFRLGGESYAIAEETDSAHRLVLLKPLTYMNLSGQAVSAWSRDAGVAVTGTVACDDDETVRPVVVCDDLSLPLGSVRLRPRGSSGGQNGLESVIEQVGGEEFPRLRLGIAPLEGEIDPAAWPDHVLADFDPGERSGAEDLMIHAADTLEFWLEHGLESTISRFNRRIRPDTGDPA
ncbi:MAG: aminoacyl-tRNA hydrolase [Candidatus Krumholzibacteriota bacterium]